MRYTVFLQNRKGGRYVAWVPTLPACKGEGDTRAEALEMVQNEIKDQLMDVEVTQVEVDLPQTTASDPWLEAKGMFTDGLDFEGFLAEIRRYRRAIDDG